MKEYIGKRCKISIGSENGPLIFTARIEKVDEIHITFLDKFNKRYTFKRCNIEEISELGGDKNETRKEEKRDN